MDIIKADKCLRHQYGPLVKGSFNNPEIGVIEGEPAPPRDALKARVAAYKKDIKDAATAATVAEDTLAEASEPIELDSDDKNNSDNDAYAAFEDINDIKAIGVEDKGDSVFN